MTGERANGRETNDRHMQRLMDHEMASRRQAQAQKREYRHRSPEELAQITQKTACRFDRRAQERQRTGLK